MKKLSYLIFVFFLCFGCTSETNKQQNNRNNIVNVKNKIIEIEVEDVLIGDNARSSIANEFLIIKDSKAIDEQIHIFDKNNFNYLASTAQRGQGPDEITNIGTVESNATNRTIYVSDHGKYKIFSYELDSIIANPLYKPQEKMKMKSDLFPISYQYINDTLCIGLVIAPIGNSDFKEAVAKWNMLTGNIQMMKYEHPQIEKKRISFAASMEYGIYVECYLYHDLMTICGLDGNLKYNIYGKNWNNRTSNSIKHYGKVIFVDDKILAAYSGGKNFSNSSEYYPTRFFVFDLNGDYIKTIETGYKMIDFCYDRDNNRIIMVLDDVIQFAYLPLDKLM